MFRQEVAAVCGLTQADQDVIDENAEAGIAACRWQRPLPKTPTCQELRAAIAALRAAAGSSPPAPKRKGALQRLREKVRL